MSYRVTLSRVEYSVLGCFKITYDAERERERETGNATDKWFRVSWELQKAEALLFGDSVKLIRKITLVSRAALKFSLRKILM